MLISPCVISLLGACQGLFSIDTHKRVQLPVLLYPVQKVSSDLRAADLTSY
jgi:hypothetical protein